MTDQLDSPRVITNALGEVTNRRDFKPFGEEIAPESSYRTASRKYGVSDNIRQKFTGYQKDTETQLDFAEARMYQNLHGRFTAVDPLLASGKSANPQTFNRYVYVINNPLIFTDPSGLQLATGRWVAVPKDGGLVGRYLPWNEDIPKDGYEITQRNRSGELIAPMAGREGYVYRLNPIGPMSDDTQRTMILMNKVATPYEIKGYEEMMSDELYDSLYESMNGDINAGLGVQQAISPGDVALFFTPFKGVGATTGTTRTVVGGFSQYARRDAAIRAEVAKDNFLLANPGINPSVVIGAADIKSTLSYATTNGPVPTVLGRRMEAIANGLGGVGARMCGNTVGRCAEFRAANALELRGANPNNLMFTRPFRPRTSEFVPVCEICQQWATPLQFPRSTQFRGQ